VFLLFFCCGFLLLFRPPAPRFLDQILNGAQGDDSVQEQSDVPTELQMTVDESLCPNAARMGTQDVEGGWFTCDPEALIGGEGKGCVVSSFGIRGDWNFDEAMQKKGCEVHGFEPSPDEQPKSQGAYESMGAHFHPFGLGLADATVGPGESPFRWPGIDYLKETNTLPWTLKRLPTIMESLGHSRLSFLKIDIEGGEWDSWMDVVNTDWDVFATELHFPPKEYFIVHKRGNDAVPATETLETTIVRNGAYPRNEEPADPPWVDRIYLLRKLLAVSDVWKIEPHPDDKSCMNVYFKRTKRRE